MELYPALPSPFSPGTRLLNTSAGSQRYLNIYTSINAVGNYAIIQAGVESYGVLNLLDETCDYPDTEYQDIISSGLFDLMVGGTLSQFPL